MALVTRGYGPGATLSLIITMGYHTEALPVPPVQIAVFAVFSIEPRVGAVFTINDEPEP